MKDEKVVKDGNEDRITPEERKRLRDMLKERQNPLRLVKGA